MSRLLLPILLALTLLPCLAGAQPESATPDVSARELLEAAAETEKIVEEKSSSDPDGIREQNTPLAAMLGLRETLQRKDYDAIGQYLDRRYTDESLQDVTDRDLLKALGYVFNQQNIVNLSSLSDEPEGKLDDGLPSYRDLLGVVQLMDEEIPVYLQRVPDGKGGRVWKISNATVDRIPDMWEELGYSSFAFELGNWLPEFKFLGMENWQVAGMLLFFLIAWPVAGLVSYALMRIALLIPNRFPLGIKNFFMRSFRFFLFVLLGREAIDHLGLSLTARVLLDSSGIMYLAVTVLLLGLISLLRDYQIRKMQYAGNAQYVALLKPFTTMVKVILVTIIALYWAKQAGYDMSTIIAGLGVGSLAVALAAQKTLENMIGAITLYTARPVSAGDFCRFGDTLGTVEEIGLRSTLIRTLDRSMVVIPNSVFSSVEIENFSQRDRIRYFRRYQMQIPKAEHMRHLLEQIRGKMQAHEKVLDDTISVRFEDIRNANAILRLDAGIDTTNFQEFLAVAEELNLGILEAAEAVGALFTGPAQLNLVPEGSQGEPGSHT